MIDPNPDDVAEARRYIATFRKYTLPGADMVQTTSDEGGRRTIMLDDMTDADAIFVAREFRDMEAQAARRGRRRRRVQ